MSITRTIRHLRRTADSHSYATGPAWLLPHRYAIPNYSFYSRTVLKRRTYATESSKQAGSKSSENAPKKLHQEERSVDAEQESQSMSLSQRLFSAIKRTPDASPSSSSMFARPIVPSNKKMRRKSLLSHLLNLASPPSSSTPASSSLASNSTPASVSNSSSSPDYITGESTPSSSSSASGSVAPLPIATESGQVKLRRGSQRPKYHVNDILRKAAEKRLQDKQKRINMRSKVVNAFEKNPGSAAVGQGKEQEGAISGSSAMSAKSEQQLELSDEKDRKTKRPSADEGTNKISSKDMEEPLVKVKTMGAGRSNKTGDKGGVERSVTSSTSNTTQQYRGQDIVAASGTFDATKLTIQDVKPIREGTVAKLGRGLDRVLFNPPVYFLRDPNSLVYNFDPELENIPRSDEFAFDRLPAYITASEDEELLTMAKQHNLKYYGSTSTLTTALSQIYFLISGSRPIDISNFSSVFSGERSDFTAGAKLPASLWVRAMPDGKYAVDNEKSWDIEENVLSDLGKVMEKMLTSEKNDFKRFLKSAPDSGVSQEEREERETYRYCKGKNLLMRSQLDCHDSRLPGNGTFDIKTRAAMVIRHDRANHEENSKYDIYKLVGMQESFEKEFYDMSRAAFLKYSMQVRIGGMDGIFVAYHNTARIFGFQYVPLREMDRILHGTSEMGEQAFNLSVHLLEKILETASDAFPGKTFNLILNTQENHLVAAASPEPDAKDEGVRPAIKLTLRIKNTLNNKKQTGPIEFENVGVDSSKVKWTLDYELTKTPMTPQGYALGHAAIRAAERKFANMASLALPEGKTATDMLTKKETVMAKEDGDVESEHLQKDEKATTTGSTGQARAVKWKEADKHIQGLRQMAKDSGKKYAKRIELGKGKKQVVWRS